MIRELWREWRPLLTVVGTGTAVVGVMALFARRAHATSLPPPRQPLIPGPEPTPPGPGPVSQMSDRGLAFVADYEKFVARPYNDAGNHCTVGFGHLIHYGPCTGNEPAEFRSLTKQQAYELFRRDIEVYVDGVRKNVTVELNQHQFDALASFTFNNGVGALRKSTLLRKLNNGDYASVPAEMAKYNLVCSGAKPNRVCKVSRGLVNRRRDEGRMFSVGDYTRS